MTLFVIPMQHSVESLNKMRKKKNKLGLSCAKLSKLKLDTNQLPARVLIMSWNLAILLP